MEREKGLGRLLLSMIWTRKGVIFMLLRDIEIHDSEDIELRNGRRRSRTLHDLKTIGIFRAA